MVMETIQIRLTSGLIRELDTLVGRDIYPSKSEAVRDAVRRLILAKEQGAPPVMVKQLEQNVENEIRAVIKQETNQYQKVKGAVDFYPEEKLLKESIFRKLKKTAIRFNFKEVETPSFETLELLTAKGGEEVADQIFKLEQKGNEQLGLRFDITIPATRMFVTKQRELVKPVKWFYITRMWRYEAPQKGRLREFYQYGCELFGSQSPKADAEVINLALESLKNLKLTENDIVVKVNNRKLLQGLLLEVVNSKILDNVIRIIDKSEKITEDELESELRKLGLVDSDIEKVKNIIKLKGKPLDILQKIKPTSDLAKEGYQELKEVIDNLKQNLDFIKVDLSVARGLAYYTGTVFEIFDKEEKLRAIAGGGRYDKMVEQFKGEPTPATGFGMGYETLRILLEQKGVKPKIDLGPDYYIAPVNKDMNEKAEEIALQLRKNFKVEVDLVDRKLGKQFSYADSIKAKKIIIVGPDEVKFGKVVVRDMATGKEEKVPIDKLGSESEEPWLRFM
ncbi:histidine--tRNA ligase [Nanoarchaeota archaeon]